jgi:stage III sporulation protein AG
MPKVDTKSKKPKLNIINRLKGVKHIEFYIAGIAIGLMLFVYFGATIFGGQADTPNNNSPPDVSFGDYQRRIEYNAKTVVSSMRGVGRTEIAIAWESSVELVIAYITINNGGNTSLTPQLVTENGTTKPIVVKEIYPQVLGVAISCEGGNDARVRLAVIDTVSILLNVSQTKVIVQGM